MRLKPKNILVPTDLSFEADFALDHALEIAKVSGADVHMLHVQADRNGLKGSADDVREAYEHMESAASRRLDLWGLDQSPEHVMLHTQVVQGLDVVPAVLAYVHRAEIDMIVMATRGRYTTERRSWESQAEAIIRSAPCPVLTIGRAALTVPGFIRRIVVPMSFDRQSKLSASIARHLAAHYGASVDLVHVVPARTLNGTSRPFERDSVNALTRHIEAFFRSVSGPDVNYAAHVRFGEAGHAISHFASERDAHLIVMTTRAAQGVELALKGSTAAWVVGTAPCAVLTLKQSERRSERKRRSAVPLAASLDHR
jgi:nucleotide-binding universal stress UspA family protein